MELTREDIEKYLAVLTAVDKYDEEREQSVFDLPGKSALDMSVTRCTCSAMLIAEEFGGTVYGYELYDQPWAKRDMVAYNAGGHDFAMVGNFLVDWWSVNVEEGLNAQAIFDMNDEADRAKVARLYAPVEHWERMYEYEPKYA